VGCLLSETEQAAYLDLLGKVQQQGSHLEGVMLYSLARPSMQTQAVNIAQVTEAELDMMAKNIRRLGLEVRVTA